MNIQALFSHADWATVIVSAVVSVASVILTNALAWANYRRTYRLEDRSEAILRGLLKDKRFVRRKFETIQAFVPLTDDKLKEALLRAGAVQLTSKDGTYWSLLENSRDRVFPKGGRETG